MAAPVDKHMRGGQADGRDNEDADRAANLQVTEGGKYPVKA